MILRRLCEAAPQFEFPPPGYQKGPVKWIVDLDAEGQCRGFVRTVGDETKKNDRGKEMAFPFVQRTSGVAAQLLADKADYTLGVVDPGAKPNEPEKVKQRHAAFMKLLDDCAAQTSFSPLEAVREFLEPEHQLPELPSELQQGDMVTFRVDGQLLIEQPEIREYWAKWIAATQASGPEAPCLVCGKPGPVANPHPRPIKGVPGGNPGGCALVSVNARAFGSYGHGMDLTQAPVCWTCADTYAQTLNALLASPNHHFRLQDRLVYVFWTREPTEFDLGTVFIDPQPEQVQKLLETVHTGQGTVSLDRNQFYALSLSGSRGRVIVRDWLETTVGHVQQNLGHYLEALDLVDPDGQTATPPGLYALMAGLIPGKGRDPWKELPPNLAAQFVHAVLNGNPLPDTLLARAVARARAEQGLTRPRAALIKLCLLLSSHPEEGLALTPDLNPELDDAAYLCGRLLAILENIQSAAIPGAKATLIDKYYGTASTAPAAIFGLLMRQAQAHLGKLRKNKEGAHHALQQALEDVAGRLGQQFPRVLDLNQQGKFALGYYQQRAADRKARSDAAAAKKQNAGATGTATKLIADSDIPEGGNDNV
ncbi:MAG: type I-C CRISPR-associated protein Cas8c/Csd1 [Armatimonadetes bacterium]|nr:type I-C CRISPR-associated protein Cas8c/Csd1 [Armatimonadota bacterium]